MHSFSLHSPLLLLIVLVASLLLSSEQHSVEAFGIGRFQSHKNTNHHEASTNTNQQDESSKKTVMMEPKGTTTATTKTTTTTTTADLQFRPRIEVIHNTQEYLDFISQDDRLCVVK